MRKKRAVVLIQKGGRVVVGVALLALNLLVAGCGDGPQEAQVQAENAEVLGAMAEAIQDEYRAESIYEKVLEEFGSVQPFSNIIYAEMRHSEAIAGLYQTRGLEVPEDGWKVEQIPSFFSVAEACRSGVVAEIENAEIYEKYFSLDLPSDVRRVFENNQAASLDKHLPAFRRCS